MKIKKKKRVNKEIRKRMMIFNREEEDERAGGDDEGERRKTPPAWRLGFPQRSPLVRPSTAALWTPLIRRYYRRHLK
jgi:hypothetical protein